MATLQTNRFYKVSCEVQTDIVVNELFLTASLPGGHACTVAAANQDILRETGPKALLRPAISASCRLR
jgi:hypothetical protein